MSEADHRLIAAAADYLNQWHRETASANAGRGSACAAVQQDRLNYITRVRAWTDNGRRWKARVLRCIDCNHPALTASLVSDILLAGPTKSAASKHSGRQ